MTSSQDNATNPLRHFESDGQSHWPDGSHRDLIRKFGERELDDVHTGDLLVTEAIRVAA